MPSPPPMPMWFPPTPTRCICRAGIGKDSPRFKNSNHRSSNNDPWRFITASCCPPRGKPAKPRPVPNPTDPGHFAAGRKTAAGGNGQNEPVEMMSGKPGLPHRLVAAFGGKPHSSISSGLQPWERCCPRQRERFDKKAQTRFESRLDDSARLWTAAALCRFGNSSRVRKRQGTAARR